MLLSRLRLTNYRQYHDLDMCFKDGITGIVGPNGAGKSTILEAVLWCLFGNRAARTDKEGIKRQTAAEEESCEVELEFSLGGASYCLKRSLVGKSQRSEAVLTQSDGISAISPKGVDDYIVRLIGLNLKGFLSSFFARQRELNALSDAQPAGRKDHLAKMLGVGWLDSAIELLKDDIKSIRGKIDILSGLQIDPETVQAELAEKQGELARLEEQRAKFGQDLAAGEAEVLGHSRQVEAFQKTEQEFNRLENTLATLTAQKQAAEKDNARLSHELAELAHDAGRVGALKQEVEDIQTIEKDVSGQKEARLLTDEKKRLGHELAGIEKTQVEIGKKKSASEEAIGRLGQALYNKEGVLAEIKTADEEVERLRGIHREVEGGLKVAEDKLATLAAQKEEIRELGPEASCKMCLRPLAGDLESIEKHFDEEIRLLRSQVETFREKQGEIVENGKAARCRLDTARKEWERLQRLQQELASATANLQGAEELFRQNQKRILDIKGRLGEIGEVAFDPAKLAALETRLAQKRQTREEYIRIAERLARRPEIETGLARTQAAVEECTARLKENADQKAALGFDRERYQQAMADFQKARDRTANIRLEMERTGGRMKLLASEVDRRRSRLDEYEKSQQEISRLREALTCLEKLSILFGDFRVYLIGRIRPSLSKRTSQLFHEMTGGRYQEIELDEDYALRVYDRGESFPITRFSGGEIDLANLCFRLAISVEMAATAGIDQSFIILDEIFGSQDAERQRLIFEGLGRLKNRFRQIIIISHIDDVKEMAENIISVDVDAAGISHAVIINS